MKFVGFLKPVKREWLDMTADELIRGNLTPKEIKEHLKNHVSNFYKSAVTTRKAVSVLLKTWVEVDEEKKFIRDLALALYERAKDEEKIALHFGLLILNFPIFNDIIYFIGKSLYLDEKFRLENIRKKIFEKWGERQTILYSINNILFSLKEWGLIINEKNGVYTTGRKINISDSSIKCFLILCYLKASNRSYLDFNEIGNLYSLFPFEFDLNLNEITSSRILSINKIGANIVIGA
ncbi:VrlQ [Caldanaerobacter subterraneus KAk]|uniref:Uncharacterized protein n=1 Tax=Caldanaerobacter subterraneus subsp. pacificus DSM 12653 TaxID=391606 RepID=B7R5W1_9THEO|nr:hypothetical protein [Caldanaerobacter subterraneus]KKC29840.1 hypothetical protein CDSM653_01069 [Caldanaerobacter subterraneus subsp. pacificus DSM 12653]